MIDPREKRLSDHSALAQWSNRYLERLSVLHRSSGTIEHAYHALKAFETWAAERDLVDPIHITRSILESYQRWLYRFRKPDGRPLGITTQYKRVNQVRHLFAWLCRERVLEANPASELEMPRLGRRLPVDPLSVREVECILAVPDIRDPLGLRDKAVLELFYSTGIRRAEMARLELCDLQREKKLLFVRQGKGRKDRVVPVGARAMDWMERYLDQARPLLSVSLAEPALFLTQYGERFNVQGLGNRVSRCIDQAGINRKGSCHMFRHACATHMLEGGADIRYIQQLLGHEQLETTAIYADVSIHQLQAVHAQCHPAGSTSRGIKSLGNPSS